MLRKLHQTIRKITEDFAGRWHFNTSIAAVMELVNALTAAEAAIGEGKVPDAVVAESLRSLTLLLAPLFDIVGRKPMIAGTYILSGALLIVTGLAGTIVGIRLGGIVPDVVHRPPGPPPGMQQRRYVLLRVGVITLTPAWMIDGLLQVDDHQGCIRRQRFRDRPVHSPPLR